MLTQAEIDALLSGAIAIEGKDGGADVNLAEFMGWNPHHPATNNLSQEVKRSLHIISGRLTGFQKNKCVQWSWFMKILLKS